MWQNNDHRTTTEYVDSRNVLVKSKCGFRGGETFLWGFIIQPPIFTSYIGYDFLAPISFHPLPSTEGSLLSSAAHLSGIVGECLALGDAVLLSHAVLELSKRFFLLFLVFFQDRLGYAPLRKYFLEPLIATRALFEGRDISVP